MFKKKVPIKYITFNSIEYADFKPAKAFVPKWYKDIQKYEGPFPPLDATNFNKTVKACTPFLDALTSGYMITTSFDIVVTNVNGSLALSWAEGGNLIISRDIKQNEAVPVPAGHSSTHFVWKFPISMQIPKGYSMLVTHPLNRFDLPFTSLSGIIDGPYVMSKQGNFPFFMKEDFEGVIPQGTPIAQVIPFKNEEWKSIEDKTLEKDAALNYLRSRAVLEGWYKRTFWQKKRYE